MPEFLLSRHPRYPDTTVFRTRILGDTGGPDFRGTTVYQNQLISKWTKNYRKVALCAQNQGPKFNLGDHTTPTYECPRIVDTQGVSLDIDLEPSDPPNFCIVSTHKLHRKLARALVRVHCYICWSQCMLPEQSLHRPHQDRNSPS